MTDINELRRLTQEATPGPWYIGSGIYEGRNIYSVEAVTDDEGFTYNPVVATAEDDEVACWDANARLIAAANPAGISELLDRLEAAEADALEQARLNGMGSEREAALMAKLEAAEKERDWHAGRCEDAMNECAALRSKIEAMEKQEPVAWARKLGLDVPSFGCVTDLKYRPSNIPESSYIPLYTLPGAQPAPSLASNNVSLISEGKTQPAQSVKDAIIDDLQSQFDTEGITEHDSGDALIRLSDAIAAVEDNFVQIAPSVPSGLHPLETVRFWADAYTHPGDDNFRGHGMAAALLREYAELRAALAAAPGAKP